MSATMLMLGCGMLLVAGFLFAVQRAVNMPLGMRHSAEDEESAKQEETESRGCSAARSRAARQTSSAV